MGDFNYNLLAAVSTATSNRRFRSDLEFLNYSKIAAVLNFLEFGCDFCAKIARVNVHLHYN